MTEIGPVFKRLQERLQSVIVGQQLVIDQLLVGLLAEGHVLLEGVPGTGVTGAGAPTGAPIGPVAATIGPGPVRVSIGGMATTGEGVTETEPGITTAGSPVPLEVVGGATTTGMTTAGLPLAVGPLIPGVGTVAGPGTATGVGRGAGVGAATRFCTITVTGAAFPSLSAESLARASSTCGPSWKRRVSHSAVKGGAFMRMVCSLPST